MNTIEILSRFENVKPTGKNEWQASCPCSANHKNGDAHQSLSITKAEEKTLVYCHAGCSIDEICNAAGFSKSDLFDNPIETIITSRASGPAASIQAAAKFLSEKDNLTFIDAYKYDYGDYRDGLAKLKFLDASGNKTFRWIHAHPQRLDSFKGGHKGCPNRLFVAGNIDDDLIVVAEGEKDAQTVKKVLDITGVSSENGATKGKAAGGKWRQEYNDQLKGKTIYILNDNDTAGNVFVRLEADNLKKCAKAVYLLDITKVWKDCPEKGDISDMVEALGPEETKRLITELMKSAVPETDKPDVVSVQSGEVLDRSYPVFVYNNDGSLKSTISNVVEILEYDDSLKGRIRYNEISYSVVAVGSLPWRDKEHAPYSEWSNADDANLRLFTESDYGLSSKDKITDALQIVSHRHPFNPIKQMLVEADNNCPLVEGSIRRLVVDYLGADDSEYNYEVMKLIMVAAVKRVFQPGCKFDLVLVLIGSQGIGKSTFLKYLAGRDEFFGELGGDLGSEQALERIRGLWIIELAELASLKKTKEVEGVKSFVSTRSDRYREKYSRRAESFPRICIFCGTTNNSEFLTDKTGNRRFLPVACHKERIQKTLFPDDPRSVQYDFALAWKEALNIYKADPAVKLVMPENLMGEVLKAQQERELDDPNVGMIQAYLDNLSMSYEYVCAKQIYHEAIENIVVDEKFSLYNRPLPEVPRYKINEIHQIMQTSIKGWEPCGKQRCGKVFGIQRAYRRISESETETNDVVDQKQKEPDIVEQKPKEVIDWKNPDWDMVTDIFGDPKDGSGLW